MSSVALPEGWKWAPLGEIAATQLGKMLSAKARVGANIRPYLRNKNVQWGRFDLDDVSEMNFSELEFERFRLRPNDLLVCEGGEVGRCAIWREEHSEIAFQKALHRIRPRDGVRAEWIFYWLSQMAESGEFGQYTSGIGIPHLPQEDLRRIPIAVPPLAEQDAIVAELDRLLGQINLAQTELDEAEATTSALDESILMNLIGQHRLTELGALTGNIRYGTSVKCSVEGSGPAVLRIPNVRNGRLDLSDLKFASVPREELGDCFLAPGDLLFVRTNGSRDLIGRVAVVEEATEAAFASYLIRVRPDTARLDPRFAVLVLSSLSLRSEIEARAASTAGQYNLNIPSLKSLMVPLPSLAEQRRVVENIERVRGEIAGATREIKTTREEADSLRRAVLRRAFRGQLDWQATTEAPGSRT